MSDASSAISRERAWALLTSYTSGDSLLKHALAVEAAVRGYARRFGEDEVFWGNTALLHDFDYERYPSLEYDPFRGADILRAEGFPEPMIRAILSHGDHTGVARESRLEHTLFACDELSGFIVAAALVRPSKSVLDLEVGSVKKRMKDKAFSVPFRARTCSAAPTSSACRWTSTSVTSSRPCAKRPSRSA